MSYYSSAVTLNAEGDTSISEETLEGLGMESKSRFSSLSVLFGAIIKIAEPPQKSTRTTPSDSMPSQTTPTFGNPEEISSTTTISKSEQQQAPLVDRARTDESDINLSLDIADEEEEEEDFTPVKKLLLTDILPDPGYFAAGAVAGVVSRTSTAPLDRLKVYLIANIGPAKDSINAVKKGDAVGVAKTVGRPLIDATKELWKAGGMRSLFAGICPYCTTSCKTFTAKCFLGNGLNVIKVMPESAIKFGSYEFAKRALAHMEGHDDPQNINPYSKFVAGGVGGLISQ